MTYTSWANWTKKDTILTSETSPQFCKAITNWKEYLSENSYTAQLWIPYIHYVNIVKQCIWAERTGTWEQHLMVVREMFVPFFRHNPFPICQICKVLRTPNGWTTISSIIFWDFLMFYQIFLSSQVKQTVIISDKHGIYEFAERLET